MAEKKVAIMVLKVDLQCEKCYKKVKKVLSKFPQIRDQKYDDKANMVKITVVSCSPEKIRDKICRKGCGVIKSIEILPPPKPLKPLANVGPKKEEPEVAADRNISGGEPTTKTVIGDPPPQPQPQPEEEGRGWGIPKHPPPRPPRSPLPPLPPLPPPPPPYPSIFPMVVICLVPYCAGYGGGSGCHHGHERPTPCYDGCGCGRHGSRWQSSSGPGYSDGCRCGCGSGGGRGQSSSGFGYSDGCGCRCGGGGREGYATRSDQYYYEENPQTCRIM